VSGEAKLTARYGELPGRLVRCAAGSVVSAVVSELTFLACYGPLAAGPRLSSVLAFVAGAVPNYVLNRRWVWRRTGRARLGREVLPYVLVSISTGLLAIVATSVADAQLRARVLDPGARTLAVGAAYLLTYGVMFVVKFALFDRFVFAGGAKPPRRRSRSQVPNTTRA
jgi:putative flippase GtrA